MFGHGSGSIISRKLGEKDIESARRFSATGFYSALFAGIFFLVFLGRAHVQQDSSGDIVIILYTLIDIVLFKKIKETHILHILPVISVYSIASLVFAFCDFITECKMLCGQPERGGRTVMCCGYFFSLRKHMNQSRQY